MRPFVKDHSAAAWLCASAGRDHVRHDAEDGHFERWDVDSFFDGWAASGFTVDFRWEDQPEQVVPRGPPADESRCGAGTL